MSRDSTLNREHSVESGLIVFWGFLWKSEQIVSIYNEYYFDEILTPCCNIKAVKDSEDDQIKFSQK